MNIFDQYGIKEVADVTLYSIHKKTDGSGDIYYVPALYLDTLKISSVEKTAESTWAQGGKGNAKHVSWDYNKEINISLEDALCTPASLGLCWNGILGADWKNARIDINTDICSCKNPIKKLSRLEKVTYARTNNEHYKNMVSRLLPQTGRESTSMDLLCKSEVVDGTRVEGIGKVLNHSYKWRLIIETGVRSVAQVPDRFFDIEGRSYPIDWNSKVSVFNGEAPTYSNFKDAIIYKIGNYKQTEKAHPYIIFDAWMDNHGTEADKTVMSLQKYLTEYDENTSPENNLVTEDDNAAYNVPYSNHDQESLPITQADFLAIVVDNNDIYHAYVGIATPINGQSINNSLDSRTVKWYKPEKDIVVTQFKGLDMWLRFSGINALTYFLLTKYEDNIISIIPCQRTHPLEETDAAVDIDKSVFEDYDDFSELRKHDGKLWAYVDPKTMQPFDDDYWFHSEEQYFLKSLTLSSKEKQIKGNRIVIEADQWPGMYMMIGETYIRDKDTNEDSRIQLKFPLCKVKSEQTITLEADGEPTVFNLDLEVAKPRNGPMAEFTAYEVATKMVEGENGCYYAVDGSTEVLSE